MQTPFIHEPLIYSWTRSILLGVPCKEMLDMALTWLLLFHLKIEFTFSTVMVWIKPTYHISTMILALWRTSPYSPYSDSRKRISVRCGFWTTMSKRFQPHPKSYMHIHIIYILLLIHLITVLRPIPNQIFVKQTGVKSKKKLETNLRPTFFTARCWWANGVGRIQNLLVAWHSNS